jgi:uncharacterized protein involved in type VI secretion and phage assembly
MKSFIIVATSIACIGAISHVADAHDRSRTHSSKNRTSLTSKEHKSSGANPIAPKDFKGIEQAILNRYKKINDGPKYPSTEGPVFFYEVKSMKISYFSLSDSSGSATVEAVENQRSYTFEAPNKENEATSKKYKYTFSPIQSKSLRFMVVNRGIKLIKESGKWRVLN